MNGEIPDRVPIFECLFHDDALTYFGNKKPIQAGDRMSAIKGCSGCLDLCHPMPAPSAPREETGPDGQRVIIERWSRWDNIPDLKEPPDKTQARFLKKVTDEIEIFEAYKITADEIRRFKEEAARCNAAAGDMVYMHFGVECALLSYPIEQAIYLYADNPELMLRWNKAANRMRLARLEALVDVNDSPVIIVWNDLGIKDRLLYPMHMLEKFFFPYLRMCCEIAHDKGVKVFFHSDGNIYEAMDRLIECGIDALNPLETTAGMDYALIKEKYGKKVPLAGGMDAVEILAFGTADKVVEETKRLVEILGKGGGWMAASASGEIDNSMPFENVLAFYETIWKYGVYK